MPLQRRQRPKGIVASLPGSRLPVGTPRIDKNFADQHLRSPTASRLSNRPASSASSHAAIDSDADTTDRHNSSFGNSSAMAAPSSAALSLAEARLRRQNERILLADPTLSLPTERARPLLRAKGKAADPKFELSNSSSRERDPSEGGVPVSEVRINTYHTSNDGNIPQRPYSSLSQHTNSTTTTAPNVIDRQDSAVVDDAGFQTMTRRGGRRIVSGQLGAYEEKPEEKQATVEATVDQREILKVFAQVLPGIDFLMSYVGYREGQVQFIQHPNGDVSAHIWSMTSNVWDNLGGFSNIRKKIEGQLAGDHLKGETAYQKMQQNTLAYFRTIAKQREALMSGAEFGQAEIQQLLPEPEKQAVPNTAKKLEESPPVPVKIIPRVQASAPTFQPGATIYTMSGQQQPQRVMQPRPNTEFYPPSTATVRTDYNAHYPIGATRPLAKPDTSAFYPVAAHGRPTMVEDPFSAEPSPYADLYTRSGPEYRGGTVAGPAKLVRQQREYQPFDEPYNPYRSQSQHQSSRSSAPSNIGPLKPPPLPRTFSIEDSPQSSITQNVLQQQHQPARVAGTAPTTERRNLSIVSNDATRSNPILQHRETLRENLFRISDHAVERSQSRENLANMSGGSGRRSFLHDPFRTVDKDEDEPYTPRRPSYMHGKEGQLNQILARHHGRIIAARNASSAQRAASMQMPTGWSDAQLPKDTPIQDDSLLTGSTPDYEAPSYTPIRRGLPPAPTYGGGFNSDPRACWPITRPAITMTPEEELRDWWTSGNKFARQESYFQSIMALSAASNSSPSTVQDKDKFYRIANPNQPSPLSAHVGGNQNISSSPSTTTASTGTSAITDTKGDFLTRLLIPVYENLLGYVDGPIQRRRDYWCRWSQPPEMSIDRSGEGGDSFYEKEWTTPGRNAGGRRRLERGSGGVTLAIGGGW